MVPNLIETRWMDMPVKDVNEHDSTAYSHSIRIWTL
jgi:hypothetical protein